MKDKISYTIKMQRLQSFFLGSHNIQQSNLPKIRVPMRFRIDFNTLWYAQKTPAFPYQRRSNKPARHDFVVNGADVCKFARLKRGNALWIQYLNLVFESLELIWQPFKCKQSRLVNHNKVQGCWNWGCWEACPLFPPRF